MSHALHASLQAAAEYWGVASRGMSGGFRTAMSHASDIFAEHFFLILAILVVVVLMMAMSSPRVR